MRQKIIPAKLKLEWVKLEGSELDVNEALNKLLRDKAELGWEFRQAADVRVSGKEDEFSASMMLVFERL